ASYNHVFHYVRKWLQNNKVDDIKFIPVKEQDMGHFCHYHQCTTHINIIRHIENQYQNGHNPIEILLVKDEETLTDKKIVPRIQYIRFKCGFDHECFGDNYCSFPPNSASAWENINTRYVTGDDDLDGQIYVKFVNNPTPEDIKYEMVEICYNGSDFHCFEIKYTDHHFLIVCHKSKLNTWARHELSKEE
ncbi:hypothetical protein AKO1_000546, partial [Acrasis kona]